MDQNRKVVFIRNLLGKPWFWLLIAVFLISMPGFAIDSVPYIQGEGEWSYSGRVRDYVHGSFHWQPVANGLMWMGGFIVGAQATVTLFMKRLTNAGFRGVMLGVAGFGAGLVSAIYPIFSDSHVYAAVLDEVVKHS